MRPKCDTHGHLCLSFGNMAIVTYSSTLISKIIVPSSILELRLFLRNKNCRTIFFTLSLTFPTKHCFEKGNKKGRSPCSQKICDKPINTESILCKLSGVLFFRPNNSFLTFIGWLVHQDFAIKNIDHRACLQENFDLFLSRAGWYKERPSLVNVRPLLTHCARWSHWLRHVT